MNNSQGVVYVTTGEDYVKMAAMSAQSVKASCPNLPVHIFTDVDVSSLNCFDTSTSISNTHAKYGCKVDYFLETPYEHTLYLDADTKVCEDITPMFGLLDRYDIAIAYDSGRGKYLNKYIGQAPVGKGKRQKMYKSQAPSSFLPVNSGVILYKDSIPASKFFQSWKKAFHEEGLEADQFTLRDQLWLSDLKLWILPPEYNCRPRGHIKILKNAMINPKILHLNDFKREAGIPPISSLPMRGRIKHIYKHIILTKFRKLFLDSPY
jgi:lipopolysaccharide biosynthesis glycosyltransferase